MRNQWSDKEAAALVRSLRRSGTAKPLAECIYGSRLLGARKDLVLHGGGNTSVKARAADLSGNAVDALYVKASGHNLDGIGAAGFAALDLAQLTCLEGLKTLSDDDMLAALTRAKLDPSQSAPSVESLLHAFLPAPYICHTHANAVLALTNQPDGKKLAARVFGPKVIVLPYAMSGFALAKKAAAAMRRQPDADAVVVMKHGVFTVGETAKGAFGRMIRLVSLAEQRLAKGRKTAFPKANRGRRRARRTSRRRFGGHWPLICPMAPSLISGQVKPSARLWTAKTSLGMAKPGR